MAKTRQNSVEGMHKAWRRMNSTILSNSEYVGRYNIFVNALELSEGVVGALLTAPTPVKISIVLVVGYFVFLHAKVCREAPCTKQGQFEGKDCHHYR